MRSDDEDDEDEYYDENEEEDDEGLNGVNGDEDDGDGDDAMEDGSDDDASDADEDGDEGEEDDEDEDEEGDDDNDDDEEEGEDNEEEEEDEQDQEASTEDEGEGEAEGEDGDIVMDGIDEEPGSIKRSRSRSLQEITPNNLPPPPHILRRNLFIPSYTSSPKSLSIEAIVGIPLPSPVHSLTSTSCLSYLLAGSQDGYVRVYDFWSSVNGGQMMTAQQRSVVGLGETVNKAGVGRGWWANEVDGITGGSVGKRAEPVYSMACESDGLFALTGTQSGPINLFTLRHAPGHHVHSLKGHTNVVSCMSLLPSEKGLLSGSWDGTVREWDLNTGQTVRSYPTHGAQLSSLSFRPFTHPASPTPSPRRQSEIDEDGEEIDGDITTKENISISMGLDFFSKEETQDENATQNGLPINDNNEPTESHTEIDAVKEEAILNGDVEMAETKSEAKSPSMDSLFGGDDDVDADAEGETVPPSIVPSKAPTPLREGSPTVNSSRLKGLGLALPGQPKPHASPTTAQEQATPTSSSAAAPLFIPQSVGAGPSSRQAASHIPLLSPTSYKSFSDDVVLTSSMDGQVVLIDRRIPASEGAGVGVGRLMPGERAPPWCMSACWSSNGTQVLAGRRNGMIDVWDVRRSSSSSSPNLLRTLRTPAESGPISCLVSFPDARHIATASQDNVRLWNTAEYFDNEDSMRKRSSKPPFKIIAGHHGGTLSSMIVDPTGRFLITASGDRGWQGESTKVVLIHEVKW
ncbi:uncharacterized protein IL334_005176 [Kwoniella shivajii]|uniref:Transcription factor spt8 beta-propeller domain-containing protein n=1 Tax=Kwoniella shivajii TaxID=564305 RepID=A0ABZ1D2F1_9TREE|nr:hypothetical protein IL334_005176 [Kwoniella shivajii]